MRLTGVSKSHDPIERLISANGQFSPSTSDAASFGRNVPRVRNYTTYDFVSSQTYTNMAARPLNDDEVLNEMNKMVRSSIRPRHVTQRRGRPGGFHQARGLGKGSGDQGQG